MRKVLKIVGIILGSLLLILGVFLFYLYRQTQPEAMARFIHDNPGRASVCFVQNDTVFAAQNIDSVMPLASTVKIIVAVEYARQVAAGVIDPAEKIDTAELEKFYVAGTDGDAHPSWMASVREKGLLLEGKVPLGEVAKGMIRFSSNANTEYLLDRLGIDSVNAGIQRLGLKKQERLYPFVASLFIGQGLTTEQIRSMSEEKYIAASVAIHEKLKTDTSFKRSFKPVTLDMQRVWSDRLPGGTTREYAGILKKINRREFFSAPEQQVLDELMEGILDNPKNREWLVHAGFKGGSTAFVFTMALYATSRQGTRTELVYFFNDLSMWEFLLLEAAANEFHLAALEGPNTRRKIIDIINGK